MKKNNVRNVVRDAYGKIAKDKSEQSCGCCGGDTSDYAKLIGYTADDLGRIPEGSNLGLGCGNPTAIASLEEGEGVLDLGSGAGFDVFLAASRVGDKGKVIGVDMTDDMLERARDVQERIGTEPEKERDLDSILGEIENL